jgi:hypothetical protein
MATGDLYNCIVNSEKYNGHAFRSGAATSVHKARLEDHLIQTLGRWSSDCYTRYMPNTDAYSCSPKLKVKEKEENIYTIVMPPLKLSVQIKQGNNEVIL